MEAMNFKHVQQTKQHVQLNSDEFSFAISLHPPTAKTITFPPPPFPAAIDLSPADEIFFHGHLLPLHLLSHLATVSPRSSTNSQESFTLPIKELPHHSDGDHDSHHHHHHLGRRELEGKGRGKSKSFSLFAMPRWRKRGSNDEDQQKQKSRFDLLKRYVRFMKPFLSMRNRRPGNSGELLPKQQYSYSGYLRVKNKKNSMMRGWRGELSAPTNSGTATPTTRSTDSTMEEFQAAIQAAITHCKNSIAAEDKKKLPP